MVFDKHAMCGLFGFSTVHHAGRHDTPIAVLSTRWRTGVANSAWISWGGPYQAVTARPMAIKDHVTDLLTMNVAPTQIANVQADTGATEGGRSWV